MAAHEEQLRRLALHDEAFIDLVLAVNLNTLPDDEALRLSPKTHALVRLAALLALGRRPSPTSGTSAPPSTPAPPPTRSWAP